MLRKLVTGVVLATVCAAGAPAQELVPFSIDWNHSSESAVDLSGFLKAPAGKDGHIRVQGEYLIYPDGSRFRIFGVNICANNCFPDKDLAPLIAADLARLGINVVRFHHMDATWGRNIFPPKTSDTRTLDADALDKLDFFIAELKQRGIYSNLNLNVSRRFRPGDNVRDAETLGYAKGATYFNPRIIELQQEFARQLLTHRNAYTGNEYRHEPAVVVVETVNENSLLEAWCNWRLTPKKGDPGKDTWAPLPEAYCEELTDQYNDWLRRNVSAQELEAIRKEAGVDLASGRVPRTVPNDFARASKLRFSSEAKFLMETEVRFFEGMKKLLKDELGVKALLVGSADHNDWISGYPHIRSNAVFDLIDGHGYWEHPNTEKRWIKNTPMVNDPLDSTIVQFARTPMAGKPFTISEVNHPFPHEYACEGFPLLTAYALLHDWDGIYWFDYGLARRHDGSKGGIQRFSWFDFSNDPVKQTGIAASALMWHRQDVAAAKTRVVRSYSPEQVVETLRMDRNKERPFFTPGFARSTALQFATRWTSGETSSEPYPPAAPLGAIESETKQLAWHNADRKRGVVTFDTERSQGLIGFIKGSGKATRNLSVEVDNDFCAVMCTSMDGKALGKSSKLLLATMGKTSNTGFAWAEDRKTVLEWGKGPVLIEPVKGSVTLKGMDSIKEIRVTPLTAEGRPMEQTTARRHGDVWRIAVGSPATTWYVIEIAR